VLTKTLLFLNTWLRFGPKHVEFAVQIIHIILQRNFG